MDQETIRNLAANLIGNSSLSDECSYTKFTELAYLSHFIECYQPTMHIAGWHTYPVYTMEDAGQKMGIAFCDLQLPYFLTSNELDASLCRSTSSCPSGITEIWLVIVAKDSSSRNAFLSNLVTQKNLSSTFDKIFLFDFFKSAIQILK